MHPTKEIRFLISSSFPGFRMFLSKGNFRFFLCQLSSTAANCVLLRSTCFPANAVFQERLLIDMY
jgi:hypothetical protein